MVAPSIGLAGIRAALKSNLDGVAGLTTYNYFPDSPELPCAAVAPSPSTFIRREGDAATDESRYFILELRVLVLVSRSTDEEAQAALDAFLTTGAGSVWDAIESAPDLDGAATKAEVTEGARYGSYDVAGATYLGFELAVDVYLL